MLVLVLVLVLFLALALAVDLVLSETSPGMQALVMFDVVLSLLIDRKESRAIPHTILGSGLD